LTSITTKRPDGQIAEQVKNAQETLGYQKIIVPKIPPGEGGYCQLKVYSERSSETWNASLKRERYSDIKTHFPNRNPIPGNKNHFPKRKPQLETHISTLPEQGRSPRTSNDILNFYRWFYLVLLNLMHESTLPPQAILYLNYPV